MRYDGKRMRLKPFALIMKSRDGKNTKTITSDMAIFDLNEPLSFNVEPRRRAAQDQACPPRAERRIRDDKSNAGDLSDDMRIGPLTTVDYDDATQQITNRLVCRHPGPGHGGDRRRHADPASEG